MLANEEWDRKESILIGKLLWWIIETETGLIDELKFYGTERDYVPHLRSTHEEYSIFQEKYEEKIQYSSCIVSEFSSFIT